MNENFFTRLRRDIPPVTLNLLIINILIWAVSALIPSMDDKLIGLLGLHYFESDSFNPIQLIGYMFLHDPNAPFHIFFNMFTLWMFGRILERVWGSSKFMLFYFVCGIGAGLVQEAVWALTWQSDFASALQLVGGVSRDEMGAAVRQELAAGNPHLTSLAHIFLNSHLITIGASGAIFGLLLGFAFAFPNMEMYIMFIPLPIKAKYMVVIYGLIEIFLGVSGRLDSVAHYAHLGGMLFGLILLLYWRKKGTLHGY